jgi:hypothetical protein
MILIESMPLVANELETVVDGFVEALLTQCSYVGLGSAGPDLNREFILGPFSCL